MSRGFPILVIGFGFVLVAALAIAGWFSPATVLHGWLIAFASLGGLALGCTAWLAIHALTGGRWGDVSGPVLIAGASALPVAILWLIPVWLGSHHVYDWVSHPESAGPGVAARYLNTGFWGLRSAVFLLGLTVYAFLARRVVRNGAPATGTLAAGLCLLLYAAGMSLMGFDWLLSLDSRYTSSAFGMQAIAGQLSAALCLAVLLTDRESGRGVWGDLGALLFACLLGEAYLLLMSFIVQWYGNLPDSAAWYLRRSHGGWLWLEVIGSLIGAILPLLALLIGRVRHSPALLKLVALAVLAGLLAENIWLVAPEDGQGGWAAICGLVGCAALACLMMGWACRHRVPSQPGGLAATAKVSHGA